MQVKTTGANSKMNNLNESYYAYPALRKFPMASAEQTAGSYGAYKMQKTAFDARAQELIEGNFKKAAAYYGIELEPAEKPAAKREMLAFKGHGDTGISMSQITTMDELDKAANFIIEKRDEMPRAVLAEPAKYVIWAASNTDVDMNTDRFRKIARIAGLGVGDRDKIQTEFEKRALEYHLARSEKDDFWKYAKEMEHLSDDEFFTEANLNTLCNVMDEMDGMYAGQYKRASGEMSYPEDIVFENGLDDLTKEASDYYLVPSIDATLSKTATLERKDAINAFFTRYFEGHSALDGDELINKVASLDKYTASALLENI